MMNDASSRISPVRVWQCVLLALTLSGGSALAQDGRTAVVVPASALSNVVHLSARAQIEVTKDWLTVTLQAVREGNDLNTVQAGLKQAIEAALQEARRQAAPGQLEVRTGYFNVGPRYGREGRTNGWQGSAELIIEGSDIARIAQLAGRLNQLAVVGSGYSISRALQERTESELNAQAVQKFRARAQELAQQFGFSGYTLREVSVQSASEEGGVIMPMRMKAQAISADASPLPTEVGKGMLSATVQGSVQLQLK